MEETGLRGGPDMNSIRFVHAGGYRCLVSLLLRVVIVVVVIVVCAMVFARPTAGNVIATTTSNAGQIRSATTTFTTAQGGGHSAARISELTHSVKSVSARTESSQRTPSITRLPSDRVETLGIGRTFSPSTEAVTHGNRHWRGVDGGNDRCYVLSRWTGRGTSISRVLKTV
jgi:hypothetical protein